MTELFVFTSYCNIIWALDVLYNVHFKYVKLFKSLQRLTANCLDELQN